MFGPLFRRLFAFQAMLMAVSVSAAAEEPPSLFIEGYTDQLSYEAGDLIKLHVSTSASRYGLEIARLGDKTDTVFSRSDVPGSAYPIPENASSNGCGWPSSFELKVPKEWRSGYYNVRL